MPLPRPTFAFARRRGAVALVPATLLLAAAAVLPAGPAAAQLDLSTPGASDFGPLPPPGTADDRPARPDPLPLGAPRSDAGPEAATGGDDDGDDGRFSFSVEGGGPTGFARQDGAAPPGQLDLFDPDVRDSVRCGNARYRTLNPAACGRGPTFEMEWRSR